MKSIGIGGHLAAASEVCGTAFAAQTPHTECIMQRVHPPPESGDATNADSLAGAAKSAIVPRVSINAVHLARSVLPSSVNSELLAIALHQLPN